MILWIEGYDRHYEMENLCRIFFPYQKIQVVLGRPEETAEDAIQAGVGVEEGAEEIRFFAWASIHGERRQDHVSAPAGEFSGYSDFERRREYERRMGVLLFPLLAELCDCRPKWGILTGIHPVKLFRQLFEQKGMEAAEAYFQQALLVSPEKTALARRTMETQLPFLAQNRPESCSLYLSVPFCPTRCSYCSFVSQTVERSARLIPQYVDQLCREVEYTGAIARELGLRLESAYIGGGTPTTLNPEQLTRLITTVQQTWDLSHCREFTVEVGRPDTIDRPKLEALRACGISRISINPQTLNDHVLEVIGRRHSAQQTIEAYELARQLGFDNINMDLIAGLPDDTAESFAATLDRILELDPENITVHSLALKHSARMIQQEDVERFHNDGATAAAMLEYADEKLTAAGYAPYYLYRQSRMVGNLENVGWAKPGTECYYNIITMDETHTVLACGAGAVSKIKDPGSDFLRRIFNFKYSYEYCSRNEEILARKDEVKTLYEQFCK